MKDDIRNILDPGSTFSEDDVLGLLTHAQKKKTNVWGTIMFFRRHNQLTLALDWLREQGDKKLSQLADVLPKYFEELECKPKTPMVGIDIHKHEQGVTERFEAQSRAIVINN